MGMLPGMKPSQLKDAQIDEKQMARTEAIIYAMTPKERVHPEIIGGSRKQRIARGSGTRVEDVNKLLKQFDQMKKMMKQMMGAKGLFGRKGKLGGFPGGLPF